MRLNTESRWLAVAPGSPVPRALRTAYIHLTTVSRQPTTRRAASVYAPARPSTRCEAAGARERLAVKDERTSPASRAPPPIARRRYAARAGPDARSDRVRLLRRG